MNPLIGMMAKQANASNPTLQMLSKFNEFRRGWTPEAAQQQINSMVASGKVTAQQVEQARQMAQQVSAFLK